MSVFKELFGKVSMLSEMTNVLCLNNLHPKLLCWLCKIYNQHWKLYSSVAIFSSRDFFVLCTFQRINSPPSSQSMSAQVVSMTTPSMHPHGLSYPTMTSAYSSGVCTFSTFKYYCLPMLHGVLCTDATEVKQLLLFFFCVYLCLSTNVFQIMA